MMDQAIRVKICGITNEIDAQAASELGADMVGFVFYDRSKRYVAPEKAKEIIKALPASLAKAGVFVDEKKDVVLDIAKLSGLDTLQFHGDEDIQYCDFFKYKYKVIKAFRIGRKKDLESVNEYNTDFYLFDSRKVGAQGGTGESFDWKLLEGFRSRRPYMLSGGLTAENVETAIKDLSPYGVDVSTGVEESPCKKSELLMKEFIKNAKGTDAL